MTSHDFEPIFYIQTIRYDGRINIFPSMEIPVFSIFLENISGWREKKKKKLCEIQITVDSEILRMKQRHV